MPIDFRERGREGEIGGEKHTLVAPQMCPGWESNGAFGLWEDAPTN